MTAVFVTLLVIAVILILMALELIILNQSLLNTASMLLLLFIALMLAGTGLGFYLLHYGYEETGILCLRARSAVFLMIGPAFFFFSDYFPRGRYSEKMRWLTPLLGTVFFLPVIPVAFGAGELSLEIGVEGFILEPGEIVFNVHYRLWYSILIALSSALALFSAFRIASRYRDSLLIYQKKEIRYFLTGFLFALVSSTAVLLLGNLLPWVLRLLFISIIMLIFGSVVLYVVSNYRFVNIRKMLTRLLKQFLAGMVFMIPAVFALYLVRRWAADLPVWAYFLIIAPILVVLFQLFQTIRILALKVTGKEKTPRDFTSELLAKMGSARNLEELAESAVETLLDFTDCRSADFLLYDWQNQCYKTAYRAKGADYTVPKSEALLSPDLLDSQIEFFDREQIHVDPRFAKIKKEAVDYFERYKIQILIPLRYEGEVISLIHLSDKFDGSLYSAQETERLIRFKNAVVRVQNELILFAKEREAQSVKRELDLAAEIQSFTFQKEIPEIKGVEIFAYQKPVTEVSGDYYHIQKTEDGLLGFLIADVSGKGVSAALVAMMIHALSSTHDFHETLPNEVVSQINDLMSSNIHASGVTKVMSFATVFCGLLDREKGELYYTNAGHLPLLVTDEKTGFSREFCHNGKPAGIFQSEEYEMKKAEIPKGSIITAYSDGISEAFNDDGEEFGENRLKFLISEYRKLSAEEIAGKILGSVADFSKGRQQTDDITLLIFKV